MNADDSTYLYRIRKYASDWFEILVRIDPADMSIVEARLRLSGTGGMFAPGPNYWLAEGYPRTFGE